MKTASIRQIRHDFSTVLSWVEGGEQVGVTNRGKVVALLSPPPVSVKRPKKRPDFAARLKLRDGNRVISATVMNEILDFNKGHW
jgi:antitoxin (DNA-binding transcriptional repressor) of toxin-antitoxin stability system